MKRFALAIALACVLSSSAFAGDGHTVGTPAPGEIPTTGSPSPGQIPTVDSPGEIPSGGLSVLLAILNLAF